MVSAPIDTRAELYDPTATDRTFEAGDSAVAWAAIVGGAFAAAALALILLALGSGFGLLSVSPWPNSGASATTFSIAAGIWLIVVQWLSSAFGGYLTGRLRTKWVGVHTHEVFFRDTANGFLAWALAALIGAAVLASAASGLVGNENRRAATNGSGTAAASQGLLGPNTPDYYVDTLFRSDRAAANPPNPEVRAEAARIFGTGVKGNYLPADASYLARLVAAATGLPRPDAERRVAQVTATAKADLDRVRRAGGYVSIFTALSMLIGAFIAAAAAALGGQHRDEEWRVLPRSRPPGSL